MHLYFLCLNSNQLKHFNAPPLFMVSGEGREATVHGSAAGYVGMSVSPAIC
jgi:hypothetical protein